VKESCSDDGEHGAGSHLLRLLRQEQAEDVIVICARWFGGVHIGPKRFDYINGCAKEALSKLLHEH
jgi:putative IMPACT (imprinted ancient) family translation regulator